MPVATVDGLDVYCETLGAPLLMRAPGARNEPWSNKRPFWGRVTEDANALVAVEKAPPQNQRLAC
jgi:hypothetical protein